MFAPRVQEAAEGGNFAADIGYDFVVDMYEKIVAGTGRAVVDNYTEVGEMVG